MRCQETRASIEDDHGTCEEEFTHPGIVHPTPCRDAPVDTTEAVSAGPPARRPVFSGLKEEEREIQTTHDQHSGSRPGVVSYDNTQQTIRPVTYVGNKILFCPFVIGQMDLLRQGSRTTSLNTWEFNNNSQCPHLVRVLNPEPLP